MNKKAEIFQKYINDRHLEKIFHVSEKDDEWHTTLFTSFIDIHGNRLPTAVIFDDTIYGLVRVQIAPQAMQEGNELKMLRFVAEENVKYKPFKLYFGEDGSLIMDICLIGKESDDLGDMVYAMFDVVIQHLTEKYKSIMQSIWS